MQARRIAMRRSQRTLTALAAVLLVSGCTGTGGDKSGGDGSPEVLVLANNDVDGLGGAPAVQWFVQRVQQLSGGRTTIRVESGWRGAGDEPRVIRDVAAGRADLGWAGTRAFDLVGVKAFQPLHVPFLVDSREAEAAVVKDPITAQLLRSLAPVGLTGLAIAADALRMPASAARPVLSPADFRGLAMGTFASQVQYDGLKALGAEPTMLGNPRPPQTNGLGALETSWGTYLAAAQYEFLPFVTGNAVLWPRTVVIFGSSRRLDRLSPAARRWIQQAAVEAQHWSTTPAADQDAEQITTVCRRGARIALASPAQLDALRAAARPALAAIAGDPQLKPLLQRVQALVAGTGRHPLTVVPAGCAYRPGDESTTPRPVPSLGGPGRPGQLPAGSYRYLLTADQLRGHGIDEPTVRASAGVWTWTLATGRWRFSIKPAFTDVPTGKGGLVCEGWYDIDADHAVFTTTFRPPDGGDCAPLTWSAQWRLQNRSLTWTRTSVRDFIPFFEAATWTRLT
jgi:TRAP-type C4-dicarboxylate transport system substrate-binding protein